MAPLLCRGNAASTPPLTSSASTSTSSSFVRPRRPPSRTKPSRRPSRPTRASSVVASASPADGRSSGGKEPTFRVSGELRSSAPPHLVWEVLTDYDGAASIFDNVTESRVLGPLDEHRGRSESGSVSSTSSPSTSSSSSLSEDFDPLSSFLSTPFEPSAIEQHCSWKFLVFGGSFRMLLGVEEGGGAGSGSDGDATATRGERSLVFSLLEPGFVREFEGVWSVALVEEDDDGEEGGSLSSDSYEASTPPGKKRTRTVVRHSLGVTPAVPPPLPVRPVVRKLFQKQVAGLLEDLEAELERRSRGSAKETSTTS